MCLEGTDTGSSSQWTSGYANKELDLDPVSNGKPLKVKEAHEEFCVLLYSLLW